MLQICEKNNTSVEKKIFEVIFFEKEEKLREKNFLYEDKDDE